MSLSRLIFVVMVVLLLATPSLASQCPIQGLGQEWESVPPTDKDVEELARKTTAVYLADNLPPSPPCTPLPDKAELQVLAACTKQDGASYTIQVRARVPCPKETGQEGYLEGVVEVEASKYEGN